MSDAQRPFEGLRVVDVSTAISGPICSYYLALLGAEVIRVDNPLAQDITRYMDSNQERAKAGMAWPFLLINSNKKSMAINFKDEEGRDIFKKLAATADVLVENFRPGVMAKLGFGREALAKINPGLIFCSISGFGQDSPLRDYPAYDNIVQAISGLMSLSGTPESGPMRVGTPLIDCLTGLTSAFAVASALMQRQKNGQGQAIDVAMADSILAMMTFALGEYVYEGEAPQLRGNQPITKTPFSGCFKTKKGLLNVAANTEKQTKVLVDLFERPDLLEDPKALEGLRFPEVGDKITAELEKIYLQKTADEWELYLTQNHIPAGKVRNVEEILKHPHSDQRGIMKEIRLAELDQTIKVSGCGFKFDHGGPELNAEPPRAGADTTALLAELGYSPEEIESLGNGPAINLP